MKLGGSGDIPVSEEVVVKGPASPSDVDELSNGGESVQEKSVLPARSVKSGDIFIPGWIRERSLLDQRWS